MKKICIILLGGTIASVVTEHGYEVVSLAEFCRQFRELDTYEIVVDEYRQLSGLETKIEDIIDIAEEVKRVIAEESVDGVVVVQGTNVMEEVAFALDVLVRTEIPVVCTGAMRPATAPSADGGANLIDAVCAAASENCRGMGVLLVFNGEIHSAQYVRKEHSLNTNAFKSEFMIGYMAEHVPSIRCKPVRRNLPEINIVKEPVDVMLYTTCAGDSGRVLDQIVELGYVGLVAEGSGGGGLPGWIADKFMKINETIPCVLASRTGHGDIIFDTYGYGFQHMAQDHGVCLSNILDSRKARILLTLLLMADFDRTQIRECFYQFSKNAEV